MFYLTFLKYTLGTVILHWAKNSFLKLKSLTKKLSLVMISQNNKYIGLGPPEMYALYKFYEGRPPQMITVLQFMRGGSTKMITIDYIGGEGSGKSQKMIT